MTRAILLSLLLCAPAPAQISFQLLGHLSPDDHYTTPHAISADGRVIIGQSGQQSFRWTPETGLTPLPLVDGQRAFYRDLSADGSILVGQLHNTARPFRLSPNGVEYLQRIPGPFTFNEVTVISADGSTIAGNARGFGGGTAFQWRPSSNINVLGDLPGGEFATSVNDISRDGNVVVGHSNSEHVTYNSEAILWTAQTGLVPLGDLPGGEFGSSATAVSADGRIVVGSGLIPDYSEQAFRWTQETGMLPLFEHDDEIIYSRASDISDDGRTVIGRCYSGICDGSFVWTEETGPHSLRSILAAAGINIEPQLHLDPMAISGDGLVITGSAYPESGGYSRTFIITIPEPALSMPLLAAMVLASRPRSRTSRRSTATLTPSFPTTPQPLSTNMSTYLALLLCISSVASAAPPLFTSLGQPPGSPASLITGLSSDARVMVGNGGNGVFRWTLETGYQVIPTNSTTLPHWYETMGISPDGAIVVGYGLPERGDIRALRWSADDPFGVLPAHRLAASSVAYDAASDGTIVGDSAGATIWKPDGSMIELEGEAALYISPDASAVVVLDYSADGYLAAYWTQSIGHISIGDLTGGKIESFPRGLSDNASTVVGQSHSSNGREAFRWTAASGILPLGDLPSGDFDSWATGVSADGSVIIGIGLTTTGHLPFIWTESTGMLPLQDHLQSLGLHLPGWTLATADAISADGLIIVGQAINPAGLAEPYLLTLPDPSLLPLALLTLLLPRKPYRPIFQ